MKRCPVCQESYNDKWKRCLKDDSPLDDLGRVSEKVKDRDYTDVEKKETIEQGIEAVQRDIAAKGADIESKKSRDKYKPSRSGKN